MGAASCDSSEDTGSTGAEIISPVDSTAVNSCSAALDDSSTNASSSSAVKVGAGSSEAGSSVSASSSAASSAAVSLSPSASSSRNSSGVGAGADWRNSLGGTGSTRNETASS